jgi:molecular chaperone DnaK
LCAYAAERAKIELSQREIATIALSEAELNCRDAAGSDVYLDVPLQRSTFNALITEQLEASVDAARNALRKAGLDACDVERVVFIGGPTQYAPLRERVAFELGIAASTELNPMTAVAEGAAIFAESLDWISASPVRKPARGQVSAAALAVTFNYVARTPADTTRISVDVAGESPGAEFQIDSLDTGWSSGRLPLRRGAVVEAPLSNSGDNVFRASVFDPAGQPLPLPNGRLVVARTAAVVDGIPASHSVALEVRERVEGAAILDYLVREGDLLPKRGKRIYHAATTLRPGEERGLNFKLWEGDITEPITDNRFIGLFSIKGSDLEDRPIPAGAELHCEYEITDSGNIVLHVQVPAVEGSFNSGRNFYSRVEAQIDFDHAEQLLREEAEDVARRLDQIAGRVPEADLASARQRVARAESSTGAGDAESSKHALDDLQAAKRLLADARAKHLQAIREVELEQVCGLFNGRLRSLAQPGEIEAFDAAARSAEAIIARPGTKFEELLESMRGRCFAVLWRQDDFVAARLLHLAESPHLFPDTAQYQHLVELGQRAMDRNDAAALRKTLIALEEIRVGSTSGADLVSAVNIVRAT